MDVSDFLIFVLCLQCEDCSRIRFHDQTLHILCHYIDCPMDTVRQKYIAGFFAIQNNYNWFKKVCGWLLRRKGLIAAQYCNALVHGEIPFDEVGILVFAMTFHVHFGVYYCDKFWCTNRDEDVTKWSGIFLYAGGLRFIDSNVGVVDYDSCYELLRLNAFGEPIGAANTKKV